MLSTVRQLKSFKKDKKKLSTSQIEKVSDVIDFLFNQQLLPTNMRDHLLLGNYKGWR